MNNLLLHRSLTEAKNPVFNGVPTSDISYGDSGSFNFRNDIWTSQYEQVFPMLYGEGYTIHEHLAPFGLVYLKELTGFFAEGSDIGTSSLYNNLSINDDLGNVNSSIETGCNTHRQTDWVKDKPGQEAYFDKNVTSKDDPDLKGRIYVGKTFRELRENNFLYYGDEKGDLYQDPLPIFSFKKDTREADGGGVDGMDIANYTVSNSGTLVGGVQYGINSMSNSAQWKYSYKISKYLKGKSINIQTRVIKHGANGVFKNVSRKITYVGGVLAIADVAIDGELRASHLLNAGMVGVSAIPVAGWIIGGGYFVADMITLGISGQSIGQHLDNAVEKPLVNDIYNW